MKASQLPPVRESIVQRDILAYLELIQVPAWRANCGAVTAVHKGRTRFVRFGSKGQSDILGLLPPRFGPRAGVLLGIEVKRVGNRPTPAQVAWLKMINEFGGVAFWANGVSIVGNVLQALYQYPNCRIFIEPNGDQFVEESG